MTKMHTLRDVFSIFHDGSIVDCKGDSERLTLTIQCNYLAELIDTDYENFYVELFEISKLDFEPWMNPPDLKKIVFYSHEDYLKTDLDILSAELKEGFVLIVCAQYDNRLNYAGGTLMISAKDFQLYDHNGKTMTIGQLDSISQKYWKEFNKES